MTDAQYGRQSMLDLSAVPRVDCIGPELPFVPAPSLGLASLMQSPEWMP